MADKRIGIYPGTFDPVTNGHVDIIRRAARLVDKLIVAISVNAGKGPAFSVEERAELLKGDIADAKNGLSSAIEVVTFDGLLMHFAEQMKAKIIVRGLRAVSDFDYEFQMTGMNARLDPDIETVFLMASERSQFISSRFVKEIHKLGGDVSQFVSPRVVEALNRK
ncbi:MAG TPA: pantetheine-phosphate adenylyltransferase [Dongiaceae bacterium]|nr:pantetheine-phosphate adenylyltransferase [Dongiaceae bacterium]